MHWLRSFGALLLCASTLAAFPFNQEHVEAELVSESAGIQPGEPFWVALRLQHDDGWHTYWQTSSTGFPTTIEWSLPAGFEASPIHWPTPEVYQQAHIIDYIFKGETFLPVRITPPDDLQPGQDVTLAGKADWLMCADVCIPGGSQVSLVLPVVDSPPPPHPKWGEKVRQAIAALPKPLPDWQVFASRDGQRVTLEVRPAEGAQPQPLGNLYFYSSQLLFETEPTQEQEALPDGGYRVQLDVAETAPEDISRIIGVLAASEGWGADDLAGLAVDTPLISVQEDAAVVAPPVAEDPNERANPDAPRILLTLGAAFLGGLILNLMPCVFPVLGIKVISFVNQAGKERGKVVLHGLVFAAGVLISFWALALVLLAFRITGENVGWGFQLQSPAFVFVISILLLLFGLNMSGVFEVGQKAVGVGGSLQAREGFSGSFFSGVLATVVATPCSAPFLAGALGVALARPPAQMLLIFTFVAIGLAFPYLILSAFPQLARRLPRPGAWMESLKQGLAFLLYASVAFLIWSISPILNNTVIYGDYAFLALLFALVLTGCAAWIYGRWAQPSRSSTARSTGIGAAAAMLLVALVMGYPRANEAPTLTASASMDASVSGDTRPAVLNGDTSPHYIQWRPGLPEQLAAQGNIVYVDFTARWCATCQTNKFTVFSSDDVIDTFRQKGVIALKADWTARDPAITQELAKYGKAAVPFNLIYHPNQPPIELPPVLTPSTVLIALDTP